MDVRSLTVGPVAENCFVVRRDGADRGLIVDPGDEADRILGAVDELGLGIDAILLTHTHFDHIGAVAPVAAATGAPVYCPELEVPVLADIMAFVPWPGFGPYESYDADETRRRRRAARARRVRDRRPAHPRPQPRPRHLLDPRRARRCSPATSSSRARSAASTCPAATGRRCSRTLRDLLETLPGGDHRLSRPHGDHDDRRRARDESVPALPSLLAE